ncbi:MAG TPA: hypothetical protein VLK25_05705, partial [Allosphingosinicella sp.]|nr:hypothetical protein [Allosphingosinicella sp.]
MERDFRFPPQHSPPTPILKNHFPTAAPIGHKLGMVESNPPVEAVARARGALVGHAAFFHGK